MTASSANSPRLPWEVGVRRARSLALHFALAELEEQRNNLTEARKAYEDAMAACSDRVKALLDAEPAPAESGGKAARATERELEAGRAAQALSLVVINYMRFARRNPVRGRGATIQSLGCVSLTAAGRAHRRPHSAFPELGRRQRAAGCPRHARHLPPGPPAAARGVHVPHLRGIRYVPPR